MGLSKKDGMYIQSLFREAVTIGKAGGKSRYKQTEKRLYAYPVLQRNITRYKKDIEDIKTEDMKKSHDFVIFFRNSGSGEKPDLEELRAAKIVRIEQKIARDEKEIEEIKTALQEIQGDEYYKTIELHYFKRMGQDAIAEELHCDKMTVWRNRKRLINEINVSLYGAEAL